MFGRWRRALEEIERKRADVNKQNKDGWTPLHSACCSGHKEIVEMLIRAGADIYIQDNRGRTALDIAESQHFSELTLLIHREYHKRI